MTWTPPTTDEEVTPAWTPPATDQEVTPTGLNSFNDILTPHGKQIASELYTPTLKYGGMAAAGIAGAPIAAAAGLASGPAAPVVAPATEVALGAGGYAAGGSLAAQLDKLIGYAPPGTPRTTKEQFKKQGQDLYEGAQQEVFGRAIGTALGTVAKSAASTVKFGAEKAGELVSKAQALGINLSPSEVLGTKPMQYMEAVLDHLPWTAGIIDRFRLGQMTELTTARNALIQKAANTLDQKGVVPSQISDQIEEMGLEIKNSADRFVQRMGQVNPETNQALKDRLLKKIGSKDSYTNLDVAAKQSVQQYQADLANKIDKAYTAVATNAPKNPMTPENLLDVANTILTEQEGQPSTLRSPAYKVAKQIARTPEDVPPDVLQAYQQETFVNRQAIEEEYPELLSNGGMDKSYSELKGIISALNEKKYAQVDTSHGTYQITNTGRLYDKLISSAQQDMSKIISSSGDEDLIKAHEVANSLFKQKLALFEDPAFLKINDQYPGAVAKTILQSGDSDLISRYRGLVGDNLFNKAQAKLTNGILGLEGQDIATGDEIRSNLLKLGEGINQIYSPAEQANFKQLAKDIDERAGASNEFLNNPLLKKMTKEYAMPSGVAKAIVTPGNPGNAAAIEQLMGSQMKQKVAMAFLPQLLSANQQGNFLPQTFAEQFNQYGRKTLEAWYGPELTNQLADLAQVSSHMRGVQGMAKNPYGTAGSYLIGYWTAKDAVHTVASVVTGGLTIPAIMHIGVDGVITLGARQLAKLYASPMGANLFIQGLKTPSGTKAATMLAGRIMAAVGNEEMKSQ